MNGSDASKANERMQNEEKQMADEDSDWEFAMLNEMESESEEDSGISALAWSQSDNWIITGHQDGDIRFWAKEFYKNENEIGQNKYLKKSLFYYLLRGSMKRHSESISSLSL